MQISRFKTSFAERIFKQKYAQGPNDTWDALAERLVEDVCLVLVFLLAATAQFTERADTVALLYGLMFAVIGVVGYILL